MAVPPPPEVLPEISAPAEPLAGSADPAVPEPPLEPMLSADSAAASPPRPGGPSLPRRAASWVARVIGGAALGLTRFAEAGLGFLWAYVLASVALGSSIWFAKHRDHLPEILTNKVAWDLQLQILRHVIGSFVGLATALVITLVVVRVRSGRFQFARTAARVGAWLTLLLAAPLVTALFIPSIESSHAVLTLIFCVLIAVVICIAVYRGLGGARVSDVVSLSSDQAREARREKLRSIAAVSALLLLWAGYGIFFSRLAVVNHHGLQTRTTDLGYYDNIFYQSIHGHFLGCSFIKAGYHGSAHFDPILVLLSPLYLVYPHAEFLLVFQSVWLGSAVIPIYLIARHWKLGRVTSVILGACFVLHPAVQGANMYEFHSLTLANVAILWTAYLLETRRLKAFIPVFLLTLLVREDLSLIMCFVGMSAMMRFSDRRRWAGFAAILVSLFYFAITKVFFMTSKEIFQAGPEAYSYAYYYEALTPNQKGFGGFIVSLFTNPVFVVQHILDEAKIVYFLTIFAPLAFLPFLAKKGRFLLFYGLFFTLLASRTAVFSTHFQYSTTILPFAFFLAPAALARIKESGTLRNMGLSPERLAPAMVAAMFACTLVVSAKFGGILDNQSFRGGFSRVVRVLDPQEKETYAWVAQMSAQIPKSAAVAATDKMGPHISNRSKAFFYGDTKPVDYVFVDEHELRPDRLKVLQTDTQRGALVEVSRKGSMVLLKTSTPTALAAATPVVPSPTPPAPGPRRSGAPSPLTPKAAPDPQGAEDDRDRGE